MTVEPAQGDEVVLLGDVVEGTPVVAGTPVVETAAPVEDAVVLLGDAVVEGTPVVEATPVVERPVVPVEGQPNAIPSTQAARGIAVQFEEQSTVVQEKTVS